MSTARNTVLGAAAAAGIATATMVGSGLLPPPTGAPLPPRDRPAPGACIGIESCAAFAYCDHMGMERSFSVKNAMAGMRLLANGEMEYPRGFPRMTFGVEAMTAGGEHVYVERELVAGQTLAPLEHEIFHSTIHQRGGFGGAARAAAVETVQAGTCEITRTYTDEGGIERTDTHSLVRDRLPAGWTCAEWTEGLVMVPVRDLAGRSVVPSAFGRAD